MASVKFSFIQMQTVMVVQNYVATRIAVFIQQKYANFIRDMMNRNLPREKCLLVSSRLASL
jgi:hypothetical protein